MVRVFRIYFYFLKFDKVSVHLMKEFNMGELVIPMIWGYATDVTYPGYFPYGLFERLPQVMSLFIF
jgi:hypothetical protein